jgi:hypothetical protein
MSDNAKYWPAWRYGPDGQSAVFNAEDEVPAGWASHPGLVKEGVPDAPPPAPKAPRARRKAADAAPPKVKRGYADLSREELEKVAADRGFVVEPSDSAEDIIAALEQDDKENDNRA